MPLSPTSITSTPVVSIDVRDRPLDALRQAYEDRLQLVTDASAEHPREEELSRSAVQINELERRCRPPSRHLPRRDGPDPSTFLG